jgi:hypothetical protein
MEFFTLIFEVFLLKIMEFLLVLNAGYCGFLGFKLEVVWSFSMGFRSVILVFFGLF